MPARKKTSRHRKTLLVTGGAGFVGSHLIDALLAREYRVICLDLFTYAGSLDHLSEARARFPSMVLDRLLRKEQVNDPSQRLVIIRGDLTDTAMLTELFGGCDGCISLAAETHVDFSYHAPGIFVRSNINAVHSLLETMRASASRKRLLHVSTDEVYGEVMHGNSRETDAFRPRNVYSATKACGDLLVSAYAKVFGIDAVTVRPCNMFGPRQQPKDLIPKTISHLLHGKKMTVHGNGRHVREYLYVKDAVNLLIDIFEKGAAGEVYNLSSRVFHTTIDIVTMIAKSLDIAPKQAIVFVEDRPSPDRRYAGDNTKLRKLIGRRWKLTPFKKALSEMLSDFTSRRPPPAL